MRKRATTIYLAWIACVALTMISGTSRAGSYQAPPYAGAYKAPPSEVLVLPRYCWGQYMKDLRGPQYWMLGCGPAMNHYCPALIEMHQGMKSFGSRRRPLLLLAKRGILYTIRSMAKYPRCRIRADVENSLTEVNTLLRFTAGQ